jgi:hypothetical protein
MQALLASLHPAHAHAAAAPAEALRALVQQGLDQLPMPAGGTTLQRWRALATVAAHDLSLAKLYEGHTDALSILAELDASWPEPDRDQSEPRIWGIWAAEAPLGRTTYVADARDDRRVRLHGTKCWCSGAASVTHALLTAWPHAGQADGHPDVLGTEHDRTPQPQLVAVEMAQAGIRLDAAPWQAVGMAGSASIDVSFDGAVGWHVGSLGRYLSRPGFWQGGAGVAACWWGGAQALGEHLRQACARGTPRLGDELRFASLGRVDIALQAAAAILREAAAWIDAHPLGDAVTVARRARLAAEHCATTVLCEVGRALGAVPFGRDARFARLAADLPVFIRQCHADRDLAALGRDVAGSRSAEQAAGWAL